MRNRHVARKSIYRTGTTLFDRKRRVHDLLFELELGSFLLRVALKCPLARSEEQTPTTKKKT